MLAKIESLSTVGLDSVAINIEVDLHNGIPKILVVGLGDAAVHESRERVRSAVKNSGYYFPAKHVIISLAPADLRKSGPAFDMPIALGILIASNQIEVTADLSDMVFVGELALDSSLRHINGILPMAIAAENLGKKHLFVPAESAREASLAENINVYPVKTLRDVINHLSGYQKIEPITKTDFYAEPIKDDTLVDFASVRGQEQAKRALEISAAGAHNVLMNGAPGAGKTLMARALRSILPPLTRAEAIEIAKIHSIAGELPPDQPLPRLRPFRTVHHTASTVSIVGGGGRIRPGEISLAHRGVLFLDEFVEFPKQVLEAMRQPLEDKKITISRAQGSFSFPAQFTLIAAMNPPGTTSTDPLGKNASPHEIKKFQQKISGPIIDRIDLYIDVMPVKFDKLTSNTDAESSAQIYERVKKARQMQADRFQKTKLINNSEMSVSDIKKFCPISEDSQQLLKTAMQQFALSARGYHRILKVARTIADLHGTESISSEHIAEALQYRPKFTEII